MVPGKCCLSPVKVQDSQAIWSHARTGLVAAKSPAGNAFLTDWDDNSALFFYNTDNTYLIGLVDICSFMIPTCTLVVGSPKNLNHLRRFWVTLGLVMLSATWIAGLSPATDDPNMKGLPGQWSVIFMVRQR
jgi:hypothetical protein